MQSAQPSFPVWVRDVAVATLVMAFVSTLADVFWAAALPEHRTVYGLVHGGIVLSALGVVLASVTGAPRKALAGMAGLMIGVTAAASFYVLYPFVDVMAMFLCWMGLWLAFAFLNDLLAHTSEGAGRTVARGVAAAGMAALGFWWISGIWLGPHDPGPLYVSNFVSWCIAFAPGFLGLLAFRSRD